MRTEDEIKRELSALKRRYEEDAQPLIMELVEIEKRKPPEPVVLSDGSVIRYVGPLRSPAPFEVRDLGTRDCKWP